jgi:uncharacterized protein YggT (Ycf19 family)
MLITFAVAVFLITITLILLLIIIAILILSFPPTHTRCVELFSMLSDLHLLALTRASLLAFRVFLRVVGRLPVRAGGLMLNGLGVNRHDTLLQFLEQEIDLYAVLLRVVRHGFQRLASFGLRKNPHQVWRTRRKSTTMPRAH